MESTTVSPNTECHMNKKGPLMKAIRQNKTQLESRRVNK